MVVDEQEAAGPPTAAPPQPKRRRLLLIGALLVAAWLLAVGVLLALAAADLYRGRAAVNAVRHRELNALLEGGSLSDLQKAQARFDRAHRRLSSPLLMPIKIVPLAGRQVRSLTNISDAAARTAAVGVRGVRSARDAVRAPHASGPERVALVRRLGELAHTADADLAKIDLGPRTLLAPPVARARSQLRDQLVGLQEGLGRGAVAAQAIGDLLAGPRRYVVFAANNAEMRAGSGMFLSVGELQTADGSVRLNGMTSVINVPVPDGAVPLTGDLGDRWGWLKPNVDWRSLMLSPRFPVNAELAMRMWEASGHARPDGVLVLDPEAFRAILAATGAVTVEGHSIGADNAVRELLHDQYVRLPDLAQRDERREELGALAAATVAKLDTGSWSAAKLGEGLGAAARGRHVLAWSAREDEQRAWAAAGVSGDMGADSLLAASLVHGGSKLDQFLTVRGTLRLRPSGDHTDGTVELQIKNNVPTGEIPYIAGPHFGTGLAEGEYLGIATFNLPGDARDGRIEGVQELAVAGADGPMRVVGAEIRLVRGAERTLVAHFRLPGRHGVLKIEPSARIPAIDWRYGGEHWTDTGSHTVRW